MKIRLNYCLTCTILKFIEIRICTNYKYCKFISIRYSSKEKHCIWIFLRIHIRWGKKNHTFNRSDFNSQLLFLLIMIRQYWGYHFKLSCVIEGVTLKQQLNSNFSHMHITRFGSYYSSPNNQTIAHAVGILPWINMAWKCQKFIPP